MKNANEMKKSKKVVFFIVGLVIVLLIFETVRWTLSVRSMADKAKDAVDVYVPSGYPDDYFHNYAFQDPVSILTFDLNAEETKSITEDVSAKDSTWKLFSNDEASELYESISFLSEKEFKRVSFDAESYYCCYIRNGFQKGQYISLEKANYYFESYYIFIYNPTESLYNLIII